MDEGEASPPNDLKFVAFYELAGLAGIGGEEEHAPVRVPSRGMTVEDDVLLFLDALNDNIGVNVPILDDARDTRAQAASMYHGCRHGGGSLGSGRGNVGLKASLTCAGGGLPLVLARFCEGGKANVW